MMRPSFSIVHQTAALLSAVIYGPSVVVVVVVCSLWRPRVSSPCQPLARYILLLSISMLGSTDRVKIPEANLQLVETREIDKYQKNTLKQHNKAQQNNKLQIY